jgi:hypothetical protein
VALSAFLHMKKLRLASHVVRVDDPCITKKVMEGCFGRRRPVGKLRDRWEDAIGRDAIDLLQIWNQKSATKSRGGWRWKVREALAPKQAKVP